MKYYEAPSFLSKQLLTISKFDNISFKITQSLINEQYNYPDCVIALGNFDGVHLGHLEVIKSCVYQAKTMNLPSVVLTFDPHPATTLNYSTKHLNKSSKTIYTASEKIEKLLNNNVDYVYTLQFNDSMMLVKAKAFIDYLVFHLNAKAIFSGFNFFFGHKREGDIGLLNKKSRQLDYLYRAIGPISYQSHTLSSSHIKTLFMSGAVGIVNKLLGTKYCIEGIITKGLGLAGKILNIPTANVVLQDDLYYPTKGVYLTHVQICNENNVSKIMYGITNIGTKQTLHSNSPLTMETHIFIDMPVLQQHSVKKNHYAINENEVNKNFYSIDYNELYDKRIKVWPLEFIRPERHFNSIDDLRKQIIADIKNAHYIIKCLKY